MENLLKGISRELEKFGMNIEESRMLFKNKGFLINASYRGLNTKGVQIIIGGQNGETVIQVSKTYNNCTDISKTIANLEDPKGLDILYKYIKKRYLNLIAEKILFDMAKDPKRVNFVRNLLQSMKLLHPNKSKKIKAWKPSPTTELFYSVLKYSFDD